MLFKAIAKDYNRKMSIKAKNMKKVLQEKKIKNHLIF